MTTQYSPILKLALPVQGELSGTWGDVVNDNITSMVEQAIAGRAVINTWSTNSHTLTSANGTTSESRCAMLELTDTGTALSGAGTVICPALSKIYIVKNAAGQNITVKTASGTGILVPNGRTTFLFCDGTNVVEALTHTTSLQLGTSTTVTAVLDEDNMASDSATSLATQQSIKAYVDSKVGQFDSLAEVLAVGNTTGSNDIIVDNGQKITTNTIDETTAGSGVTIDTVLLKDDGVNATNLEVTNIKANDGTAAGSIADSTGVVTVASAVLTTADINGGTADGVVIGGTTPAAATVTTATANTSLNIAGTTTVTSILDEDNMASDDPAGLATQQSIKAYVDSQVGANNELSEVLANGNTTGGTDIAVSSGDDVTFADNSKAIFGAGSDLQIYSDGTDGYIDNVTGDFYIRDTTGGTLHLQAKIGEEGIVIHDDGAVNLYRNNALKLATTSTGIDVTGTVTADGLTVEGGASIQNDAASFSIANSAVDRYQRFRRNASNSLILDKYNGSTTSNTAKFDENGDITFYDSSGNASFVYDESAGSTFNEQGADRDFRVESDSNGSMFFVNAGENTVNINNSAAYANNTFLVNQTADSKGIALALTARGNSRVEFQLSGVSNEGATFYHNNHTDRKQMLHFSRSNVVVNEESLDMDFRVESDSYTHALFVDAGNNRVGINDSAPASALSIIADEAQLILSGSTGGNARGLKVSTTTTGYQSNDLVIIDAHNAASGQMQLKTQSVQRLKMDSSEAVFNEDSTNTDFRVESDSNFAFFFADAGNGRIGINQDVPQYTVDVIGANNGNTDGIALRPLNESQTNIVSFLGMKSTYFMQFMADSTNSGSSDYFQFHAGTQDGAGELLFLGDSGTTFNTGGQPRDFRIESQYNTHMFFLDADQGEIGINTSNPGSTLEVNGNFRPTYYYPHAPTSQTSSNNNNYWKLGNMYLPGPYGAEIVMHGAKPGYSSGGTNVGKLTILLRGGTNASLLDALFYAEGDNSSVPSPSVRYVPNGNYEFEIYVQLGNYTSTSHTVVTGGSWTEDVVNTGSTSAPANSVGIPAQRSTWLGTNEVMSQFTYGTTINETGSDHDFRVESDSVTHMLYVNAGDNLVSVDRGSVSTEKFEVGGAICSTYQGINFNTGVYRMSMDLIGSSHIGRLGTVQGAETPSGTSGQVQLIVNSSEVARLTADGITFGGDTAAVNALDDYEEGTFLPGIEFQTVGGTPTTANSIYTTGDYTKIGDTVTVNFNISGVVYGNGTGSLRLTGLPFAPYGIEAYLGKSTASASHLLAAVTSTNYMNAITAYGTSILFFRYSNADGSGGWNFLNSGNATTIQATSINGSFTYKTNA